MNDYDVGAAWVDWDADIEQELAFLKQHREAARRRCVEREASADDATALPGSAEERGEAWTPAPGTLR